MSKCKKCNEDIDTDDSALHCDDLISDKCVVASKDHPEIGVSEGDYYDDVLDSISDAIGQGGSGSCSCIEVTVEGLHELINEEALIPCAVYKIIDAHREHDVDGNTIPALYDDGTDSGTTIFLRAVSTTELETKGSGVFYNPKYDKDVLGYRIWDNSVRFEMSNVSGDFRFSTRGSVTADNGAKGLILTEKWIEYVSGDWSNASSITDDLTGATANISNITVTSYNINEGVIWGGYVWLNKNGSIGSAISDLELDGDEWVKILYTFEGAYNREIDVIEYDIKHDVITRRYDTRNEIDVICKYTDILYLSNTFSKDINAINLMQWGNDLVLEPKNESYVGNIRVYNTSFANLVNFRGRLAFNIYLDNKSVFNYIKAYKFVEINGVIINDNSIMHRATFDNSSSIWSIKIISTSKIDSISFSGNFMNNYLEHNSTLSDITIKGNSAFSKNKYSRATLIGLTKEGGAFNINYFISTHIDFDNVNYFNKDIMFIEFYGNIAFQKVPNLNISPTPIIFDTSITQKKVFDSGQLDGNNNPILKIQYWNNNAGAFVVDDITA